MPIIELAHGLSIDDALLEESFTTSTGPGGQNVNKVATAVQLRFRLSADDRLPDPLKTRLRRLAGQRLTREGDILIRAETYRSRERNREDARARLFALIQQAAYRPPKRRPTKPTLASKTRRLDSKTKHSRTKALRRKGTEY